MSPTWQIAADPYSWPHNASVSSGTTALILIDMQCDFCSPGGNLDHQGYDTSLIRAIIPNLKRLLKTCRNAGFQVYHTREGHRPDLSTLSTRELHRSRDNASGLGIGDPGPLGRFLIRGEPGHDIIPELYPIEGEPVIDKPGKGAFAHTELGLLLSIRGIRSLIFAGVTTDVCVSTTIREACDRGFDCLLVHDASAASEPGFHEAACRTNRAEGGIFGVTTTTDEVVQILQVISVA